MFRRARTPSDHAIPLPMRNPVPSGWRSRAAVLSGASLLLTACGSSTYRMVVSADPPEASVYINGQRVGTGDKRPHDLDFGKQERICVQAVGPGWEPGFEWYTRPQIEEMIARNIDLTIHLTLRR